MKKLFLAMIALAFLSSCTTCNCDLAKKQCTEAKRVLSECEQTKKELLELEQRLKKIELKTEAAAASARYSAERAEAARRVSENVLIRVQKLEGGER